MSVDTRLADDGETIEVRSSRDPDGGVLRFDAGEWTAFLAGARAGEFDPPAAQ